MIVGTAGHIDHGKTSLVKALTGVDTDRLKEEKARGISIELGYAYVPLPDGGVLGFIDVPGHEKFVATMLAGATGIDFGLLVVAADDGVMPQTREHLQILDLLKVARGAVALTKIDRVAPEQAEKVAADVHALLAGTALADAPLFAVSTVTGAGIEPLRDHLLAQAMAAVARARGSHFRLAVDRSFSLTGAGTIVTGTVFSGSVKVGDEVVVAPSGRVARVRAIHAQNRPAEQSVGGDRCALNLASLAREDVARGDWIVAAPLATPSARFDVWLELPRTTAAGLSNWSPVHVHLGATHVTARVLLLDRESLMPGMAALAQLVLLRPTIVLRGDVIVLRDQSAAHTLGRATVLDPFAPVRKRRTPERLALLEALGAAGIEQRLERLLALSPSGLDLDQFALSENVAVSELPLPGEGIKRIETAGVRLVFAQAHWQALCGQTQAALAAFHQAQPDQLGPDLSRLQRMVLARLPITAGQAVVRALIHEQVIRQTGPWLHLPSHNVEFSEPEARLFKVMLGLIEKGAREPPWVRDIAREIRLDEVQVRRLLLKAARLGRAHQVVKDLFYAPSVMVGMARLAAQAQQSEGAIKAATFRDLTGLGRKRAIQVLEYFDRIGYTRRIRDEHRLRGTALFETEPAPQAGVRTC